MKGRKYGKKRGNDWKEKGKWEGRRKDEKGKVKIGK